MKKEESLQVNLNKNIVERLYEDYCIYYNTDKEAPRNCDECILRDIEWIFYTENRSEPFIRDLCFVIYHEKFLSII